MPTQFKSENKVAHHVTAEDTCVTAVLGQHFQMEEAKQKELFALGAIYHDKKRVEQDLALPKGTYLRIHLKPRRFLVNEIDWRKRIVADTPDYLILDKPVGVPVVSTVDNHIENVLTKMRAVLGTPLFVTHRLDVGVGGLLLLARTQEFQAQFNHWLAKRKVHKTYRALVQKAIAPQKLTHYMEPSEFQPRKLKAEQAPGWQICELTIHECEPLHFRQADLFQLKIELHTGRTHQIRAQLSFMGAPLLGDRIYGAPNTRMGFSQDQLSLYASELALPNGDAYHLAPWWTDLGPEA